MAVNGPFGKIGVFSHRTGNRMWGSFREAISFPLLSAMSLMDFCESGFFPLMSGASISEQSVAMYNEVFHKFSADGVYEKYINTHIVDSGNLSEIYFRKFLHRVWNTDS